MTRSIEEKLVIASGALALFVLAARTMQLLLAAAVPAGKKSARSGADQPGRDAAPD